MPKFTIKLPNGQAVDVMADSLKAALPMARQQWAQHPDAKWQTGYRAALGDSAGWQGKPEDLGGVSGFGHHVAQGASLGFADELAGAGGAATTAVSGWLGNKSAYTPAQAYQAERAVYNQNLKDYARAHPLLATGAEIAGGFLTPGVGEATGWARAAPTLMEQAGRMAAVGAGLGAISGAGNADDGQRVRGALVGGGTGAVIGAATPYATRAVSAAGRQAVRTANNAYGAVRQTLTGTPRYFLDPAQQSLEAMGRAAAADGRLPTQMRSDMQAAQAGHAAPPTLLDVAAPSRRGGQNMRALLSQAAQKSPTAGDMAARYRDAAERDTPNQLSQLADGLMSDPTTLARLHQLANGAGAAPDGYGQAVQRLAGVGQEAYNKLFDYGGDALDAATQALGPDVPPDAVRRAAQIGWRDGLGGRFLNSAAGNEDTVNTARSSPIMDTLFPDTADAFHADAARTMAHLDNARIFPSDSYRAMPVPATPGPLSQFAADAADAVPDAAGKLGLKWGAKGIGALGGLNDAERTAAVNLGLSPATDDLIDRMHIPAPTISALPARLGGAVAAAAPSVFGPDPAAPYLSAIGNRMSSAVPRLGGASANAQPAPAGAPGLFDAQSISPYARQLGALPPLTGNPGLPSSPSSTAQWPPFTF